jgi:phage-related protein
MEIFRLFGSIFLKSDEADKTLDKVDKKAQDLDKTLAKMGKSVTNVGKTMSTWVTGPIVAAGAGILGLATKAGNTADRLLDLASITGMSTDAIQEYQHVAKIAGVNTEAITAAAEGFIKRLPQIQEEGGRASEVLDELGVSVEGTADTIMDNMLTALASIEDPLDRNAKGSQLFGGAWKDLAPILDMGTEGIAKAREEAQKMGLVMGEDALNNANDFRVGMEKLKAQFGAVFMEIGTKVAPILQDVLLPLVQDKIIPIIGLMADKVANLIEWFGGLDSTTQIVILTIGAIVASIGPFLIIVGKVITTVSTLIPIVKSLGVVIGALTGPIGLTVLAVTGLVAGIVYLWKTNEDFRNGLIKIWGAIEKTFIKGLDFIKHKIEVVFNGLKQFWEVWGEAITIYFKTVWDLIVNAFKTQIDIVIGILKAFMALFRGDWQGLWDAVRGILSATWVGLNNSFNYIVKAILGIFNSFGIDLRQVFTNIWDGIKALTSNAWQGIKNAVMTPINWIMEQVKKLLARLIG